MTLPIITYQDIMSWRPRPCYDPVARGLCTPDWSGTALDILRAEHIPAEDRLWVVLREEVIDARKLRLFAVWCSRRALARVANPDQRSVTACDIAERHANGEATDEELAAAWSAAYAAAFAATYADRSAAWSAAYAAANAAAFAATYAAWSAAYAAAWSAAAWSAALADADAADPAARKTQVGQLITMLEDTQ